LMEVDGIFRIIGAQTSVLALIVNVYNCYLITRRSPANMRHYRFYMLTVTVSLPSVLEVAMIDL